MERNTGLETDRTAMVRNIIATSASSCDWTLPEGEFYSGDQMSGDMAGVPVQATVTFTRYDVTANMTSPVICSTTRRVLKAPSFFSRNRVGSTLFAGNSSDGPASELCLRNAKSAIIGLYTDWVVLCSRKDIIQEKFTQFEEFSKELHRSELDRIRPIKTHLKDLRSQSAAVKLAFKAGEIDEQEYIRAKRPLREQIHALESEIVEKDPFAILFGEEIQLCRYVSDKRSFIESFRVTESSPGEK